DSAVAMVSPAARPLERLVEDMHVAAVIARASRGQMSLADSARHVARRSEGNTQIDPQRELAYFGAFVRTILGDKNDAIGLLKLYVAANPSKAAELRDDPTWTLRDLATDPRFKQLVGTK